MLERCKPVVVLLVLSLTLIISPSRALAPSTVVAVDPPSTTIDPGSYFNVTVNVTNISNFTSWQFRFYYLNSVLNCTRVAEGPFLKLAGSTFFGNNITNNYNSTHGCALAYCTLLGMISANGSGVMAIVTFKASYGNTQLHLGDIKLGDEKTPPQQIPCSVSDGAVRVVGVGHNIAVTNVTPDKSIVGQGYACKVTVAVANLGEFVESCNVTLYANTSEIETRQLTLQVAEILTTSFTWNTTSFAVGNYTISANAWPVPGETSMGDNYLTSPTAVRVYVGTADLTITDVTPLRTIVGQRYSASINVTVTNQGQVPGTSNITAYANQTVIGAVLNITLTSGNSTTLTFTWNTTGMMKGNFTIYAYVDPLPFELDTLNNNFTSPTTVMVGMPGDVVPPYGVIDMRDIAYVARRFGITPSALLWDPNADINGDGKVDMKDIAIPAKNFGVSY